MVPDESTIYLGDNGRAPYGTRSDVEVLAFSTQFSTTSPSATSRRSSSPAIPRGRSLWPRSGCATTAPFWASFGPGARRLRSRPGSVGWRHRDAGDDPLARLFRGDQGRGPLRRGRRGCDAEARALVEAGVLTGPVAEAAIADALAPLLGGPDSAANRSSRSRPARRSTRCCSAVPTTRSCGRSSPRSSGIAWRSWTRRRPPPRPCPSS